jgi:hypothetical protein
MFLGPPLGGITAPERLVRAGRLTGRGVSEYGGFESELKLAKGKFTADSSGITKGIMVVKIDSPPRTTVLLAAL